jgi:hypothetical protein
MNPPPVRFHAPAMLRWTALGRAVVFFLAATSIWCLLADFYHLMPMRSFTLCIFGPALAVLGAITLIDWRFGDGRLARGVAVGAIAGFLAAVAYDVFRLPFVYSRAWGLASVVPPMPLFKVFPRFGAMILGQPIEQEHYSTAAQVIGWVYHFSNGVTFGVMYTALIGDARRRSWMWGVLMAVGIELAMLYTPYPGVFGIAIGAAFVAVTMAAHAIFGAVMGRTTRRLSFRHLAPV